MKRTITSTDLIMEWIVFNGATAAIHTVLRWALGLPVSWSTLALCAVVSGVTLRCVWNIAKPEDNAQ